MKSKNTDTFQPSGRDGHYTIPVDQSHALRLRKYGPADVPYINDLSLREIGFVPRRLHKHETFMIYLDEKPIGFIAYRRVGENNLYIYLLAFEKEGQRHGFSYLVGRWMYEREYALKPVNGIYALVIKTSPGGINVTSPKYGYRLIRELPRYYFLYKHIPRRTE